MAEGDTGFKVVVGVDGSEDARAAAEMAVREAAVHGGRLLVSHAWTVPASSAGGEILSPLHFEGMERSAEALLAEEAAHLRGLDPDLTIETQLRYGWPIAVLLDLAADASLVVVGSRGMGRVAGLLLGSVSQAVVTRAPCPVLVVPPAGGKQP